MIQNQIWKARLFV